MHKKNIILSVLTAGMLAAITATPAQAITVTGSGSGLNGALLSAQATFDISGDILTISLTNTATSDEQTDGQDTPGNTLTGIFFDFAGTLAKETATITAGSSLVQGSTCSSGLCTASTTDVGGEFGFATSWAIEGPTAGYGIASSGYIGGSGTLFGGLNLDNPLSPDGVNFGIISSLGSYNPNVGLAGDPLIQDTVTFTLSGADGFSVDNLDNFSFQYGTSFVDTEGVPEPNIEGVIQPASVVPVPAAVWLFGSGLLGLVGIARRRKV